MKVRSCPKTRLQFGGNRLISRDGQIDDRTVACSAIPSWQCVDVVSVGTFFHRSQATTCCVKTQLKETLTKETQKRVVGVGVLKQTQSTYSSYA